MQTIQSWVCRIAYVVSFYTSPYIAFVHTFYEAPKTSDYEHQCTKQRDTYIQIYPIVMALYTVCVVSNKVIAPVVTTRTYKAGWLVNKSPQYVKPQSLIMRKVLISVTFPINSIQFVDNKSFKNRTTPTLI